MNKIEQSGKEFFSGLRNTAEEKANKQMREMYGCDIDAFVDSVKQSFTYCASGSAMVIAGLMSDAQEQIAHDDVEGARQTLNKAKHLLFLCMSGKLDFNRIEVAKIEEAQS